MGKCERRTAGRTFQLHVEPLEPRRLLAFLPDTFANAAGQPVGTAFNGGEQLFFTGHSGNLRFEFGQSAASTNYTGTGWSAATVNTLLGSSAPAPVGNAELYQGVSASSEPELHVVYRASGGKIIDVRSGASWEAEELVASDAVSDPEAATLNGGRQILYVATNGRVHFVASGDNGATWGDTDLTALVGQDSDPAAKAVPTSGVAAIQVGSLEYYMYHRADGAMGYFLWNGTAWGYDVLDTTDLPGFVAPLNGATGALESVSYDTSGSGTPNVGWVIYKDGAGDLRGIWLAQDATWQSAVLTNVRTASAPSAAYDRAAGKLSIAYYDQNSHLRLLREGAPWTNKDYQASPVITMHLGNLGVADTPATTASGLITFADGATISVVSAFGGTLYNGVTVEIASGGTAGTATAAYDAGTKVITVTVGGNTAKGIIATAINGLAQFNATAGGSGAEFNLINDGVGTYATLAGAIDLIPGTPAKPDIYWRAHSASGVGPSLQILYKDMSNHIHNVRPTTALNPIVLDTTAFLEGFHHQFGYGTVNAARAVAWANNSESVPTGANLNNWNLDRLKVPDAWTLATGVGAAVFAIDSGVDTNNVDLNTLSGRNIVAQTTNVLDSNGHATGVAGIIAAKNDAGGVTGVAYDARVVPVKVGDDAPASEAAIVSGIDYAMNYVLPGGYATATRVINLSLATTQTNNPESTLVNLRNKMYQTSPNAVFVTAAGNRSQLRPDYPAGFAVGFGIVAGAVDVSNKRWSPSNGTSSALVPSNYLLAPGVNVPASAIVGSSGDNHNFANASGTSIAAAHISGVIALMLDIAPTLTPREVESILIASADQTVTETVAASAPSINATLHWAGASEPVDPTTLLSSEANAVPATEVEHALPAATGLPSIVQGIEVSSIPCKATAVDEVFEVYDTSEDEALFDYVSEPDDPFEL